MHQLKFASKVYEAFGSPALTTPCRWLQEFLDCLTAHYRAQGNSRAPHEITCVGIPNCLSYCGWSCSAFIHLHACMHGAVVLPAPDPNCKWPLDTSRVISTHPRAQNYLRQVPRVRRLPRWYVCMTQKFSIVVRSYVAVCRMPRFQRDPVSLFRLWNTVQSMGGSDAVMQAWQHAAFWLNLSGLSFSLCTMH